MTKITDLRFPSEQTSASVSGRQALSASEQPSAKYMNPHSLLNPAVAGHYSEGPAGRFYGKSELACRYFPHLTQKSAWKKLKSLMLDYPALTSIATMPRRTLTTRETALIFETLGLP